MVTFRRRHTHPAPVKVLCTPPSRTTLLWNTWEQEPYHLPIAAQWRLLRIGRVVRLPAGFEQIWLDELCFPTGNGQEIVVLREEGTFRSMSFRGGHPVFPTEGMTRYNLIAPYSVPVEATDDGLLWLRERTYIRPLISVRSQLQPITTEQALVAGPWLAQAIEANPHHPIYPLALHWLNEANPNPVPKAP